MTLQIPEGVPQSVHGFKRTGKCVLITDTRLTLKVLRGWKTITALAHTHTQREEQTITIQYQFSNP